MSGPSPEIAAFESGQVPVDAIVVWEASGGWHAATVLYRTGHGPVIVHPQWCEPFMLAAEPWRYLAERVREGRGGNGYDYDVWGFAVAEPAHIEPIVNAWETEVVAASLGPMGEPIVADLSFLGKHDSTGGAGSGGEGDEVEERRPSVLVDRVATPVWLTDGRSAAAPFDAFYDLSGEQAEWGFAIPWMYRALASPRSFEPMLEPPADAHPAPGVLGYWAALLHMLIYSLGWARPDRGLRWWYDTGRPTDDPRLALLHHVWRRDGHLEDFALWLSTSTWILPLQQLAELTGHGDDQKAVEPHPQWTAAAQVRGRSMFDGGSDPYHLSVHTTGPLGQPRGEALLLRSGRTDRHAVLILDSMVGWYRALTEETTTLPQLDGRSWHIDVVVKPAGWLGTYRRSRTTGLWFSGRHRYHTPGT